jgi:hypothetical protein
MLVQLPKLHDVTILKPLNAPLDDCSLVPKAILAAGFRNEEDALREKEGTSPEVNGGWLRQNIAIDGKDKGRSCISRRSGDVFEEVNALRKNIVDEDALL